MQKKELNTLRNSTTNLKRYEELMVTKILGTNRSNEPQQAVVENQLNESALKEQDNSVLERNRALLQYTATISHSNSHKDEFNYEFIESLVKGGADIDTADSYGQTIFHEVARSWNTDIARFLIDLGCDMNKQDSFGRSPLHVSAAIDYVEMTEFLLANHAMIDAKTYGELQAPIHYAAKNGAARSLKMLLSFAANIDTLDAKNRTPLQVAAEWSRGEAAKVLIEEGAASCLQDITGNSALCVLIDHLPHLAVDALNQLHSSDIITSREYYYLQYLEASRQKVETKTTRTALETAVTSRKYEVIMHPVMQRLVINKWNQFGRWSTGLDLFFNVVFGIGWTAFALATPREGESFVQSKSDVWKPTIGIIILLMTLYDIGRHVQAIFNIFCNAATFKSRKYQRNWIQWKMKQLEYDLTYCHPRWPQEQKFVKNEMKRVRLLPLFDAQNSWLYMDWLILFVILLTIVAHFLFSFKPTSAMRYMYTRTISVVNLLVWLRLLKLLRPFHGIGTLVLILAETLRDFVNWAFLFFLIMVPFSASFWINFGPLSIHPIHGYHTTTELLFRVFQIAVGDDFNLEGIVEADPVMARILVVLYVTAMTIVTLNLLIALLSDTFSRVYSDAVANTIMQRAVKIVEAERTLTKKRKLQYKEYMKMNCNPEIIEKQVATWDASKDTISLENEISNDFVEIKGTLDDRFGKIYGKDKTSDFDGIMIDLTKVCQLQDDMTNDVEEISKLLNLASSKPTHSRHVSIKVNSRPGSANERKGSSRGSRSIKKQEPKSVFSSLQDILPRWFGGKEDTPPNSRGNRRKHRTSQPTSTENGGARAEERGRQRHRARRSHGKDTRGDGERNGTELRRRGRRKTRKESSDKSYPNRGYDPNLAWDTVSVDSAST